MYIWCEYRGKSVNGNKRDLQEGKSEKKKDA